MIEPILILTTGGTIDKHYFDRLSAFEVADSPVPQLLSSGRVEYPTCIVELLRKDSLDLTGGDRDAMRTYIESTSAERILITHGTDTMTETAHHLRALPERTIVLTGAFVPARMKQSDAAFNLGMAVATAQTQPPGIYITMNGRVFNAHETLKDRAASRFVSAPALAPA